MAKNTLPAKASEPISAANGATAAPDGKSRYRVRPGVAWINGKRVGKDAVVELTPQEAVYDLSLDRIAPADKPLPGSWHQSAATAGASADGGD
ncbi:hypothetical protein [Pseudorhizobium flavum]|uniref:hypothetical protein n=1 Tax=Pseudorhizobium flavum TaxID=1335061 RepID=UPI002493CB08|nr:hypothetical protein [Pseudorhizobium flavum]